MEIGWSLETEADVQIEKKCIDLTRDFNFFASDVMTIINELFNAHLVLRNLRNKYNELEGNS